MPKPHVTRTFGAIHFEDLDPHRFEDLIRQLVYGLKQWQSIESTGRGGSDDGFDVRAYEVQQLHEIDPSDEENEGNASHPMEGNLWMIQCKREKSLGPTRVQTIIRDGVNSEQPPYGYILAAPAHFSKSAHDKFREELRSRGVMEFYLWGAGELEDMLYQPKNDHILFGFFGISLTSRRRSKTTAIRSSVTAKNKLLRIFGDDPSHGSILFRDTNDEHYPYENKCGNFEQQPRWKMFDACEFHPLGVIVVVSENYAYFDKKNGVWDCTKSVNLAVPVDSPNRDRFDREGEAKRLAVQGFWEQLPRTNRVMLVTYGLVKFSSMDLIDEKGDSVNRCTHVFVDFQGVRGPFSGFWERLKVNEHVLETVDDLKRVDVFPKEFPTPKFGAIYTDRFIDVSDRVLSQFRQSWQRDVTIYDADGKYRYLKPMDVIAVIAGGEVVGEKVLLKITNIRNVTGNDIINSYAENPPLRNDVEAQTLRAINPEDGLLVLEAKVISEWQIDQGRPVV